MELGPQKQGVVEGEDNVLTYEGRGVCAVIAGTGFVRFSSRRERVVAQVNVGHELPDGCRPVPDRCEC